MHYILATAGHQALITYLSDTKLIIIMCKRNNLSGIKAIRNIACIALLTVVFNLSFISTGKAQAMYIVLIFGDKLATEQFHLTIDAGLNVTGMPGLDGTKRLVGLYYGMGTYIRLNDKWALTPEFKPLSQRGAKNVQPFVEYPGITDASYKLRLNYIDFPLLVRYKVSPGMYISTGPQISLLLNAKQITEGITVEESKETKNTIELKEKFNKTYFCIPLEVGFRLPPMVGKNPEFKVRYCIGLNEVIADKSYGSSKFSMWQFMLSVPFVKNTGSAKKPVN
jgi:hypothetical protein